MQETEQFVNEQPGWIIFLPLLVLSLFLGLFFKAKFSDEIVSLRIRQVANHLDPNFKVDFNTARLSLSDGLFPELTVIVEQVSAQSKDVCQLSPTILTDEIRIPFSFLDLIQGKYEINEVNLGHVDLALHPIPTSCGTKKEALSEVISKEIRNTQDISSIRFEKSLESNLRFVTIRSLRIQIPEEKISDFEMRRIKFEINPAAKTIIVGGAISLPIQRWAGDIGSLADYKVTYSENSSKQMQVEAKGIWREGSYKLNSLIDLDKKTISYHLNANHLPLSQLNNTLKKYNTSFSELDGGQEWVSFDLSSDGDQQLTANHSAILKNFKIEGDVGEVDIEKINFKQFDPISFEPFLINLRGFRFDVLQRLIGKNELPPFLANAGQFNGSLSVISKDQLQLSGESSGIEFIFSNRSMRQTQTFSLVGIQGSVKNKRWQIFLDRIRPLDGLFLGQVKLSGSENEKKQLNDEDNNSWSAHINLDELSLSPEVQKLMTNDGSMGSWSGEVRLKANMNQVSEAQGLVAIQNFEIDNLSIHKNLIKIHSSKENIISNNVKTENSRRSATINVDFILDGLQLEEPSEIFIFLKKIKPDLPSILHAKNAKLNIKLDGRLDFSWDLKNIETEAFRLSSDGGWDSYGNLRGHINWQDKNANGSLEKVRRWKIEGSRDKPILKNE